MSHSNQLAENRCHTQQVSQQGMEGFLKVVAFAEISQYCRFLFLQEVTCLAFICLFFTSTLSPHNMIGMFSHTLHRQANQHMSTLLEGNMVVNYPPYQSSKYTNRHHYIANNMQQLNMEVLCYILSPAKIRMPCWNILVGHRCSNIKHDNGTLSMYTAKQEQNAEPLKGTN